MPSKTDLANISLSLLGEEAIPLSFSDATVASKEVLKLYQHGLEIELSGHSWDFAKRRAVLAPLQEKPLFGWGYMYELPSDFLTIHMVDGESNYVIEGSKMLTDQSNSLSIIYMTRDVDPNEYHPLFIERGIASSPRSDNDMFAKSVLDGIVTFQTKGKATTFPQRPFN
jgi:hypothetical protein